MSARDWGDGVLFRCRLQCIKKERFTDRGYSSRVDRVGKPVRMLKEGVFRARRERGGRGASGWLMSDGSNHSMGEGKKGGDVAPYHILLSRSFIHSIIRLLFSFHEPATFFLCLSLSFSFSLSFLSSLSFSNLNSVLQLFLLLFLSVSCLLSFVLRLSSSTCTFILLIPTLLIHTSHSPLTYTRKFYPSTLC